MGEIVKKEDLVLCCDRLAYFAHWITPEGRPKRFDTHFFLARMPRRQHAAHDGNSPFSPSGYGRQVLSKPVSATNGM